MRKSKFLLSLICAAFIAPAFISAAHAADPLLDLNAVDPTVDPCQDFYHYACGSWIKNFQLPGDNTTYNRQTGALTESTTKALNTILEQYSAGNIQVPAKYAQKLGAYYKSCMDLPAIEKNTPSFVQGQLLLIDAVQTADDLAKITASLQLEGVGVLFNFGPAPDSSDSSSMIAQLDQGGMSFADKSYYFNVDPNAIDVRTHFTQHVAAMLELSGEPSTQAAHDSQTVLAFETSIANKALATEDQQDATKLYHPMTLAQVSALAPQFNWQTYLTASGIAVPSKINVTNPDFYTALNTIVVHTPLNDLKVYLKWQMLHTFAASLSNAYVTENFNFWNKYLGGQSAQKIRSKQCTENTEAAMTEALGEAYVNSFADPQSIKARAEGMITEIKKAFGDNLASLTWLDNPTRAAALQKLSLVKDKVGYPDKWKNFDTLTVADDFIMNTVATSTFLSQDGLQKIGKPNDPKIWQMPAWEQDAYYDPSTNSMNFPIGALIAPIFDMTYSQGANFGSIGGGWMGHELTHGFDSDGRHFDGNGNLNNWWTDATVQAFGAKTQCLTDQASAYEVLPGVTVNGKQTLTENMADQGGVKIGYIAFDTITSGQAPAPNLGPFNERQQYWVAYAQSWCTKETPESIRRQVLTDVHPPAEFRANGVLFNRPEFAQDFGCKAGSRMVPANRCGVW